jgi:uncharacterized protein YcaQ
MRQRLDELRRYAIGRSLFGPATLKRAIWRLGFVQADPIRAPARTQDLVLRHRVKEYRAGDLERHYARLGVEEDFFVNYGFLAPEFRALMHPRSGFEPFSKERARRAQELLEFVAERGSVHPREVDQHFGSGTEVNYWGGASNATTRLLDTLHYRGLLRVARRDAGIRVYSLQAMALPRQLDESAALDALIDVAVRKYAPLPAASLSQLIARLRYAAPQWQPQLKQALLRAKQRLATLHASGADWFWPAEESLSAGARELERAGAQVRLLSPFDPVVWDRRRFELFWDWAYRFEAYTPAAKRKLGYYALPLLFRDRVIGWANLVFSEERLTASFGYVSGKAPRGPARALPIQASRIAGFCKPAKTSEPALAIESCSEKG